MPVADARYQRALHVRLHSRPGTALGAFFLHPTSGPDSFSLSASLHDSNADRSRPDIEAERFCFCLGRPDAIQIVACGSSPAPASGPALQPGAGLRRRRGCCPSANVPSDIRCPSCSPGIAECGLPASKEQVAHLLALESSPLVLPWLVASTGGLLLLLDQRAASNSNASGR